MDYLIDNRLSEFQYKIVADNLCACVCMHACVCVECVRRHACVWPPERMRESLCPCSCVRKCMHFQPYRNSNTKTLYTVHVVWAAGLKQTAGLLHTPPSPYFFFKIPCQRQRSTHILKLPKQTVSLAVSTPFFHMFKSFRPHWAR